MELPKRTTYRCNKCGLLLFLDATVPAPRNCHMVVKGVQCPGILVLIDARTGKPIVKKKKVRPF